MDSMNFMVNIAVLASIFHISFALRLMIALCVTKRGDGNQPITLLLVVVDVVDGETSD